MPNICAKIIKLSLPLHDIDYNNMIQETHIDTALKELFDNLTFTPEPAGLYDPLRYMIQIGGKRIRPRLCLTAYALYKDSFSEEILTPAAACQYTYLWFNLLISG